MPPAPVRQLRTHTRYRRHLTQARPAEKQRAEKLLEDGHLKLSSVISDIRAVPGRDMLGPLAAGQRDPKALASRPRHDARQDPPAGRSARCAFFTGEHAAVLAMMLVTVDHCATQIERSPPR